jgi:hypothetical protein
MTDDLLQLALIAFGLGIAALWWGYRSFKIKRRIENVPTSKIRSMAMGLVELSGTVVPSDDGIMQSPLTQQDCVYYDYTIKEKRSSGKHTRWVTIDSGSRGDYFYLDDGTGTALVKTAGASIDVSTSLNVSSSSFQDPPATVQAYLEQSDIDYESIFGMNKTMSYEERVIAPEDQVYVLGTAGDNPFVEEASSKHGFEDVMIGEGDNGMFVIADKSEHRLVRGYAWKAIAGILGGSVLVLVGLGFVLHLVGLF